MPKLDKTSITSHLNPLNGQKQENKKEHEKGIYGSFQIASISNDENYVKTSDEKRLNQEKKAYEYESTH